MLPEMFVSRRNTISCALILEAIEDVNAGNRRLLALFGSMKEIVLPSPQEIEAVISGVFSGLQVEILNVPFSFDMLMRHS